MLRPRGLPRARSAHATNAIEPGRALEGYAPSRFGWQYLRGRHLVTFDIVAIVLAMYAALAIRYEQVLAPADLARFMPMVLAPLMVRPFINIRFGLYRRVWRFASIAELVQVLAATAVGSVVAGVLALGVLWPLSGAETFVGPSFWAIEFVISVGLIGGGRFLIRAVSEWDRRRSVEVAGEQRVPTLLFGAGHAGAVIARSAMNEPKAGVRPVGFLDDDPSRVGGSVVGLPVYGGLGALKMAIAATGARMLLITMPRASGPSIRAVMEAALEEGLEVRTVPPIHELMDGSIDAYRARPVKLEDLLGRPLATEHAAAVEELIHGRTVVITGAGGSIGSELARQVHSLRPARLVLVDRAETPLCTIQRELEVRALRGRGSGTVETHLVNVVSRTLMRRLIAETSPDVILHAAAYKHVPMMEVHPSEGVQVNIAGTLSLLDAAIAAGVPHFVFVSTDKAVEPSSVMGATKRIAEALVADAAHSSGRAYASVRFGNVLGSAGSVVPIFLSQLERGEALTVTDAAMTRYFMTIPEASWLILDAAALAESADLFVLDMGEPIRILDLARDLVRLSGRSPDSVSIEFTGLRPGEKLHEKLFYEHETVEPTGVAKILRARAGARPSDVRMRVVDLLKCAYGEDEHLLRTRTFDLVAHLQAGAGAPEPDAAASDLTPPDLQYVVAERTRPALSSLSPRETGEAVADPSPVSIRPYLPFARPSITDAERAAVREVLDSGWLTTGLKSKQFETDFAAFVGAPHAVAVNSGTAALHLALEALGVTQGDEVIVPTWTFAASAEVVIHLGATPVLIDIDPATLNLTVAGVRAAITPRTKAVIAVHVAGRPAPIEALVGAMDPLGVAVVEDAAHAFPSRIGASGRMAGTVGRIGAYSFYATKTLTTGEGGMLVTDDESLAARARLMSLHGIGRDAWKRYQAGGSWYYEIEAAGYKYNLSDLAAAIGLVQLSRADELLTARRELMAWYRELFATSPAGDLIDLPDDEPDGSHAWHLFIVRLHLESLALDRAAVIARLGELGVGASVHFIPLHLHPYYRRLGWSPGDLPKATAQYERVISLPLWPGMTRDDVERVVTDLAGIVAGARHKVVA